MKHYSRVRIPRRQIVSVLVLFALATTLVVVGCGRSGSTSSSDASHKDQPAAAATAPSEDTRKQDGKPADSEPQPDQKKDQETHAVAPVDANTLKPQLAITQNKATLAWSDPKGRSRMTATLSTVKGNLVDQIAAADDFNGTLFEDGQESATLTAPKVVVDSKNQIVTAHGGVTLRSLKNNSVVKSEWMKYFPGQHRIIGNGGVRITSDTGTFEGAAFEADTSLKAFTLTNSGKGIKP